MSTIIEITQAARQIIRMKIARRKGNADLYFNSLCEFWGQFDRLEREGKTVTKNS